MQRRAFLMMAAGGLLAAPLAAQGQPAGKTYQVGIVHPGGPYYTMIDGLKGRPQGAGIRGRKAVRPSHPGREG